MNSISRPADLNQQVIPRHLYSLDALRGLAALSVVFWHWQHFFLDATGSGPPNTNLTPLFAIFRPLYTDGWRAVDLFFCLSGFIFFWLYSEKIAQRRTRLWEFAILRFSRLYPLHIITLLIVAAGQQLLLRDTGAYFVYKNNDLYHFALQLVFASNWGFEKGYSFNGPIWSVSVEILLYMAFFGVCLLKWLRWWHFAIYVCFGCFLFGTEYFLIGHGVFSFFVGGASLRLFKYILGRVQMRSALVAATSITAIMWLVIPRNTHHNFVYRLYKHIGADVWMQFGGHDVVGALLLGMTNHSCEAFLFPATIFTLALWEVKRGTLGRRLAPLGHISYSSYLLHFPLQLAFCTILTSVPGRIAFFSKPYSLFFFFAILIIISLSSYHWFELPCQSFLRRRMLPPRRSGNPSVSES